MTRIHYLEHEFLRFQVGEMIEHRPARFRCPGAYEEPATSFFHLRGYGSTRDAALAMAGLSPNTSLQEEIY